MFQFLKYIILFLFGYKVLKELFKDTTPQKGTVRVPNAHQNVSNPQQPSRPASDKFSDAEFIDYEEVK